MRAGVLALVLLALWLAILAGGGAGGPRGAEAAFVGDINCNSDVEEADAVALLAAVAGLTATGACVSTDDLDCDNDSDAADVLLIVRYLAGFAGSAGACPDIDSVTAGTSPQQLASDLADRLQSPSEDSRYRALLHVFEKLGFGVYTADGEPVLLGEEREAGDLYFYDFELRLLAKAMGRGDSFSLREVAATLTEMGIAEDGGPVTAVRLRANLLAGVDAAFADPEAPASFLAMLVRELGLEHDPPYDLQSDVPLAAISLDPVQHFLLVTDVGAYFVYQNGPVAANASRLVEKSAGILHRVPGGLVAECEKWGRDIKQIWGVGVLIVGLTAAGPGALLAAAVIDGIHGMILAFSVEVRSLSSDTFTHYGHETPGKPLDFKIFVNMRDDLGEVLTKCGWLAGVEFPPKGPIEGVDILWAGQGSLQRHGLVSCPASTCEKTGPDGIATLHFQPDQEQQPYGSGIEHRYRDVLVGTALYLSKHNNILGKVNERITPKEAEFNWGVEWHAPSCITVAGPLGGAEAAGLPLPEMPPELAALPCTFSGTVNGQMRYVLGNYYSEDGTNDSTITFGNPVWNGVVVTYEVTGGQFTWHSEGTLNQYPVPCNFSQGATEDVQGQLYIKFEDGQLKYNALVFSVDQDRQLQCPPEDGQPIIENTLALSTCPLNNVDHVTDGSTFAAGCVLDNSSGGVTSRWDFNWQFQAGPCAPEPQPVCSAALP